MDGYAVIAADTPGRLKLVGESAAGRGFAGEWQKGGTVRISTGAAIPDGADAVVIQEDVTRDGDMSDRAASPAGPAYPSPGDGFFRRNGVAGSRTQAGRRGAGAGGGGGRGAVCR